MVIRNNCFHIHVKVFNLAHEEKFWFIEGKSATYVTKLRSIIYIALSPFSPCLHVVIVFLSITILSVLHCVHIYFLFFSLVFYLTFLWFSCIREISVSEIRFLYHLSMSFVKFCHYCCCSYFSHFYFHVVVCFLFTF